jgi:hypothetical protein
MVFYEPNKTNPRLNSFSFLSWMQLNCHDLLCWRLFKLWQWHQDIDKNDTSSPYQKYLQLSQITAIIVCCSSEYCFITWESVVQFIPFLNHFEQKTVSRWPQLFPLTSISRTFITIMPFLIPLDEYHYLQKGFFIAITKASHWTSSNQITPLQPIF